MLHPIEPGEAMAWRSPLLADFVERLKQEGIVFCHWKSNVHLKAAATDGGDFDFLVRREEALQFEAVLAEFGFKRVTDAVQGAIPSVAHFYAPDPGTDEWLHLHVYYRIITGESLLKDYAFPLEELVLADPRWVDGLPIPQAPVELLLFVIRTMLKHTSLLEYLLLRRRSGYEAMRLELEALLADSGQAADSGRLLAKWLPSVDVALFEQCLEALQMGQAYVRRLWLALRLKRQLAAYRRFSSLAAFAQVTMLLLRHLVWRLRGRRKSKQLASGGLVIAFVGPEATGKSTLVQATTRWLGRAFDVCSAHLGKPPATWLTFLPSLTFPLLRRTAPHQRPSALDNDSGQDATTGASLLYSLRAVLLAWDRRALAVRLHRLAANGRIVICDRYPSLTIGAMDSPRLRLPAEPNEGSWLLGLLARWEHALYRQIPAPQVVIRLTVPLAVALERNRARHKQEAADYLLRRHTQVALAAFPTSRLIELDSNQPQPQTIRLTRQRVWDSL